jgi:protein required for attachment to host cells
MQTLEHPAGRAKARDLVTDGQTTAFASVGGARHGIGADTAPKEHEQLNFARELARRLEDGRTGNRFDQLVLVAPPAFLGLLRDQLSPPLAKCVTQSVAKDLTQAKLEEIQQQLD